MGAETVPAKLVRSLSARYSLLFSGLMILFFLLFLLDIFLGSVSLSPGEVIGAFLHDTEGTARTILLRFRFPKALTAVLAGIALSLSGLQMQTLFRNPMAGPYVLGLSSGASLGVAFVILGFTSGISPDALTGIGNWAIAAAAWTGAGLVMLLVIIISSRVKNIMTVLILGIMLSAGVSAIVSIMQYFSSETMLKAYVIWTMGSLGNLTASQLNVMFISVVAGIAACVFSAKMLNALLLGEDYARSIGLDIRFARIIVIAGTSILAGTVTAFCGPIGFIGIAVPHIARMLSRTSDHRVLVPATIITGAVIMLASDIISQVPGSDSVLPVNSVTALIGIPIVIWVILRNQRNLDVF